MQSLELFFLVKVETAWRGVGHVNFLVHPNSYIEQVSMNTCGHGSSIFRDEALTLRGLEQ